MKHGRWETDTALIYDRDKNRLVFKVAYAFGTGKCTVSGGWKGGNQFPSSLTLEDLRIITSLRAWDLGFDILLCHYTHTINQRHLQRHIYIAY